MGKVITFVVSKPDPRENAGIRSKFNEWTLAKYVEQTIEGVRKYSGACDFRVFTPTEPSWWGKLELFTRPEGVVYYMDLDHVVIGDVWEMFAWADEQPEGVVCVRDPFHPSEGVCTSVMRIRTDSQEAGRVSDYAAAFGSRPATGYGKPPVGWREPNDTHVVREALGDDIGFFPSGWVAPYQATSGQNAVARLLTANTKLVHFAGPTNKPHMVLARKRPSYALGWLRKVGYKWPSGTS